MTLLRRPRRRAGLALLGALCLALGACAVPVRAVRVDRTVAHRDLTRSVVTTGELSCSTRNVLFERGLFDEFGEDPEAAIASLHRAMVETDGDPGLLFALAEVSFLHGETAKKPEYELAAAVYAYAFLFPQGGSTPTGPFDPRFRVAADLYNCALTGAFASADGSEVVPHGGAMALPFGSIGWRSIPRSFGPEAASSIDSPLSTSSRSRVWRCAIARRASAPRSPPR